MGMVVRYIKDDGAFSKVLNAGKVEKTEEGLQCLMAA